MENISYSSYPDSHDSSPRSREIDETQSWDEQPPSNGSDNSNYKVKLMCSYGGKIQPRPHDNQLAYIGGDTKIVAVDRGVKFPVIINKLVALCGDADICFKYQLPEEDLDALISVTNDEDLEHMMLEYDRLYRASAKPARLRLFIFHLNPVGFESGEVKSERQWFLDALNSVQVQGLEVSSPPPAAAVAVTAAVAAGNPDFLFGLEKGYSAVPGSKFPYSAPPPPTVPDVMGKDLSAGSDCGSEDRHVVGDPVVVNQQVYDFQRLQIQEQAAVGRKIEEGNARALAGEYYFPKAPEDILQQLPPQAAMPVPVQLPIQAAYLPERHGGYAIPANGTEQPVYIIPAGGGLYHPAAAPAMRPVTGQLGQAYLGVQRVAPEIYREQPVYNVAPPPPPTAAPAAVPPFQQQQQQQQQPPKVGVYTTEGIGAVQQQQYQHQNVGLAEQGYLQVGYDNSGRQLYYTTAYQAVPVAAATVDGRQGVVTYPVAGGGGGVPANANSTQTSAV